MFAGMTYQTEDISKLNGNHIYQQLTEKQILHVGYTVPVNIFNYMCRQSKNIETKDHT